MADGSTAILVFYPASARSLLTRDLEVRLFCERRGLRVPALYEADDAAGWAMIEDLGVEDAAAWLAAIEIGDRGPHTEAMMQPLEVLSRIEPRRLPQWNPPLDCRRLRWELAGFELWFVRHRTHRSPLGRFGRWLDVVAAEVARHPQRACHRDYHLNNLFMLPSGETAMIDFQDMTLGPDTYDLVSLLGERSAPELLPRPERDRLGQVWAERTRASAGWRERALWTSTQRGLKVIGTFARLELGGSEAYSRWLQRRCLDLGRELDGTGAPGELVELLLACSEER